MIVKEYNIRDKTKKLLIADRDGTLNIDCGYPHKIDELILNNKIIKNLKNYSHLLEIAIVTNQSGIGRGYFDTSDAHKFNDVLVKKLKDIGIKVTSIIICPHKPEDNCPCRKPSPLMIEQTVIINKAIKKECFMIGDKVSDEKSACKANINYECVSTKMKKFKDWINE